MFSQGAMVKWLEWSLAEQEDLDPILALCKCSSKE